MTTLTPQSYADPVATMTTSMGNISIELFPSAAPVTVNNFLTYAYSGFYNGTIFHRVVAGFVDQGGGYNTAYQLKTTLAPITLESNNGLSNLTGTVAMARTSDPNSATSQFFINAVDNTFLNYTNASNPGYAVFGNVIQGLPVVEQINAVAVNSSSVPLTNVVIQSVTTEMLYPGNRSQYQISMAGNQLAVTPLSSALPSSQPSPSVMSKIQQLQFADITVTPTADTVNGVLTNFQSGKLTSPIDIFDSASNVLNKLDSLQSIASAGKLIAIGLTDSGIPTLSLTAAQAGSDASALSAVSGYFSLVRSSNDTGQFITGFSNALGNTVVFNGTASQYNIAAAGDGVNFTVSTGGSASYLSNIQALQFSDVTVIVARTPGTSGVTSGNITELYGAVFGRLPDVAGLSYYQQQLAANPSLSLVSLAQNFLASPEYTGNSSHNYAQTTAGDTQFIADLYQNLLHRGAASSDAAWYEANVITPIVGDAKPGTAAYTAALALAHAYVVTDFSASAEFLGNVQVTAANPASSQHWLVLI